MTETPVRPQGSEVPGTYRPLHKYLNARFADTVVLTFAQIEDLLGVALPSQAYSDPSWWVTAAAAGSPQSTAWTRANRTAIANLPARIVTFDRA